MKTLVPGSVIGMGELAGNLQGSISFDLKKNFNESGILEVEIRNDVFQYI